MKRRRNPSGLATASAIAPLLPTLALVGVGYWLWKKLASPAGAAVAAADGAVQAADEQAFQWAKEATGSNDQDAAAARTQLAQYCAENPYNPSTFLLCRNYQS